MLSDLKLTILENSELDFVKENLSEADRLRIQGWFMEQAPAGPGQRGFDEILESFLWCCTEGRQAVDTQSARSLPFL